MPKMDLYFVTPTMVWMDLGTCSYIQVNKYQKVDLLSEQGGGLNLSPSYNAATAAIATE